MICISLKAFARACAATTGGISDILTFDPDDFNFTQPAAIGGVAQPYSAVALRPGAVGSGATAATSTLTITAIGTVGDVISVYYNAVLIGTFAQTAAETTPTLLAAALAADINARTSSTGFSASPAAGVITVTAPAAYGDTVNTTYLVVDITGTITYTKTAFSGGVTGTVGAMYSISFVRDEAEWAWKQSVKGCSVKYDHTFTFQLADNTQSLTTFLQALDSASCCCGLGLAIKLTSGKVFICGEKWVNSVSVPRFTVLHNGSSGSSGKLYDDFNGGTIVLTGPYSRNLYEYSGGWEDIEAFLAA